MNHTKTKKIATILNIILKVAMILGILTLLGLWKILELLGIKFNTLVFLLYPIEILFIGIIYVFIRLFNQLKKETPFSKNTVKYLRIGMWLCAIISILVLVALLLSIFVYSTYTLTLKISLAFFLILFVGVSIALYLLSELFKQATIYKEENDLTI